MATISRADAIAQAVLSTFKRLPKKFKPRERPDGRPEWVPLAGIVLTTDDTAVHPRPEIPAPYTQLECVALATGMKCLPRDKLELVQGNVLHDSHAEVLAIRAFNRFLVDECHDLALGVYGEGSTWVRWRYGQEHTDGDSSRQKPDTERTQRLEAGQKAGTLGTEQVDPHEQPFCLRERVGIHMFCSEAPCGDASMELTMAEQEDATPWTPTSHTHEEGMQGRGHFGRLGVVRRKPSRPDAPPTWSKSCSDKLAMKQCTKLLSSLTSRLVWPGNVYLSSLVLPEHQYVPAACERAFGPSGRLKPIAETQWDGGFAYRPFSVETMSASVPDIEYSKRAATVKTVELASSSYGQRAEEVAPVASNLSAIYTPQRQEKLVNGLLEGRKFPDAKGASFVSRREMWKKSSILADYTGLPLFGPLSAPQDLTYREVKQASLIKRVKAGVIDLALDGWKKNDGDDYWTLSRSDCAEIMDAVKVLRERDRPIAAQS